MGSLGLPEIAFIFVLALLIFGPKKLPEMGRTLGRGVAEFRKATNELKRTINAEMVLDEQPVPPVLRPRRLEEVGETRREVVAAEPGEVPAVSSQSPSQLSSQSSAPSPELPLSAPADTEPWSSPSRALDPDDPR